MTITVTRLISSRERRRGSRSDVDRSEGGGGASAAAVGGSLISSLWSFKEHRQLNVSGDASAACGEHSVHGDRQEASSRSCRIASIRADQYVPRAVFPGAAGDLTPTISSRCRDEPRHRRIAQ